jgi:glutathionyl-hydroquinone reductase
MVLLRTAGAAGLLGILYTTIRSTNPAFLESISSNITRNMSTGKQGITAWADKDGAFKRQVSSFRDRIEEGGKFAPEKGKPCSKSMLVAAS